MPIFQLSMCLTPTDNEIIHRGDSELAKMPEPLLVVA